MGLWPMARVAAAEADPAFALRTAWALRRSTASAAAAERKRQELLQTVASVPLRVPVMSRERLIRKACASYNDFNAGRLDHITATPDSDPTFLDRIAVNYLRHHLSSYEAQLAALFGKTGRAPAADLIRERVFDAIGCAYPELAGECDRQLARRREML
jgi:hypothetical protein